MGKKHLRRAALCLLLSLLAGCAAPPAASPVQTAPGGESAPLEAAPDQGDAPVIEGLTFESILPLEYAKGFAVYRYAGGYSAIHIENGGDYLVVPEDGAVPPLPEGYTVLQQPLDHIYLVATGAMALFRAVDGIGSLRFSGTKQEGWYVEEAAQAMAAGELVYAGKYSSPDYELLVDGGCDLALESTMIYHSPEVKEKLEELGIPVLVERSSYEFHPLGRTEWMKLYGVLLGREEAAEAAFRAQAALLDGLSGFENTEKTVAFFFVNNAGAVSVRKSSDYFPKMIELAGGRYIFPDLGDGSSATSSMNMTMEEFYAQARDADYLVYNASIDDPMDTVEQLLAKSELFADFKAVQSGDVWCTEKSLYQATDILGGMIGDLHAMLTDTEETELTFMHKLS